MSTTYEKYFRPYQPKSEHYEPRKTWPRYEPAPEAVAYSTTVERLNDVNDRLAALLEEMKDTPTGRKIERKRALPQFASDHDLNYLRDLVRQLRRVTG